MVSEAKAESEEASALPEQVFHLPENVYTYNDAKIACKAAGAELATLSQLNDAQKKEPIGVITVGANNKWHCILFKRTMG